jgi:hypothetical protein
MPTSISDLFSNLSLLIQGPVKWSSKIQDDLPGVYVVSVTPNPNEKKNRYGDVPPIALDLVRNWIAYVPTLKLNGVRPTANDLKDNLSRFWLADEPILYIGKTRASLKKRVEQYYKTRLGDSKPHAGGHWLKTLSVLDNLYVYWAITSEPEHFEGDLLKTFVGGISKETLSKIADPVRSFPFANLEYPKGNRKCHKITGSVNRE